MTDASPAQLVRRGLTLAFRTGAHAPGLVLKPAFGLAPAVELVRRGAAWRRAYLAADPDPAAHGLRVMLDDGHYAHLTLATEDDTLAREAIFDLYPWTTRRQAQREIAEDAGAALSGTLGRRISLTPDPGGNVAIFQIEDAAAPARPRDGRRSAGAWI